MRQQIDCRITDEQEPGLAIELWPALGLPARGSQPEDRRYAHAEIMQMADRTHEHHDDHEGAHEERKVNTVVPAFAAIRSQGAQGQKHAGQPMRPAHAGAGMRWSRIAVEMKRVVVDAKRRLTI